MAQPADDEKNEGILKSAQQEEIKPMPAVWAEVVSRARDQKARIEASPPPSPPPAPVAEEVEPEQSAKEMTPEEQRAWNEKLIQAGRYLKGKKRAWGIDRHIYHKIPQPLDRRVNRHVDRRLSLHVVHIVRKPVDRRIRRGVGCIKGTNPFRRMATWRH